MLSFMIVSKRTKVVSSVILIAFSMWACGTLPIEIAGDITPTISLTDVSRTAVPAALTVLAQTMAPIPTSTAIPTDTLLPPIPTRTPLPFMALDGLRVVYTDINSDLYFQDSGKPSILLTHGVKESSEYHPPLISDDGQKIIFYRAGEATLDSVYTINADGTGEQLLVDPKRLSAFGQEYDTFTMLDSLTFVPGTHLLLFNTYQPTNFDPDTSGWMPIVGNDLFIIDTDTAEIKQLKTPYQGGNFLAAPNGKWVAVQTLDHIDIIDVPGQIIQGNLVVYPKAESHIIVPMAWTQDSRELIVLPSEIPLFVGGVTLDRQIWRYPIDGGPGTEIKLNPPVVYDAYAVSPDGSWIVYLYGSGNPIYGPDATFGLYRGNLRDGTTQLLMPMPREVVTGYIAGWSSDNVHFIFSDEEDHMYLGDIHGEIVPIEVRRGAKLSDWIDANRYLMENGALGQIGKQDLVRVIEHSSRTFAFLGH